MERRHKLQSSYLKLLVGLGIALCTYFYTAPDIGTLVLLYTPQASVVVQGGETYVSSRLATSTAEASPVQVHVHVVGESSSREQTVAEKNQIYGESSSSSSPVVDTKDKPNSSTARQEKEHTEIPPLLEDKDDEPSQTKGNFSISNNRTREDGESSDNTEKSTLANDKDTTTTTTTTLVYSVDPSTVRWTFPTANTTLTDSKRAILLLSMGPDAAKSVLVERIHLSIRKRGQFLGPVIVLTDSPAERYNNLATVDPNFYVLQPLDQDWNWGLIKDMPYKRFKTFALEYLQRNDTLDSVELLYYLDIDVVVGRPLRPWFEHVETTYVYNNNNNIRNNNNAQEDYGTASRMVFFEGNFRNWPIQGGQFVLQRNSSRACLERWRYHMDADPSQEKDQVSLGILAKEQEELRQNASSSKPMMCHLVVMPQKPYLSFLSKNAMARIMNYNSTITTTQDNNNNNNNNNNNVQEDKRYPTLMHIKNTQHAAKIPDKKQREFYRELLDLTPEQAQVMGKVRIRPNRTWSANSLKQQQEQ
jgi:hypothetical protein